MIRTARNIFRLLVIARILARHDALFLLETLGVAPIVVLAARLVSRRREQGRPGERLARALQEAGPSFIKLGQALSTRSDLLGETLAADLSRLQDRLAPFSGAEARTTIETELGAPLAALFRRFDDDAVAAASIAQVHFAVDVEGREVAVKVLRPGVEAAFARDLDLFLWVAELIEAARPEWRRLKPVESVRVLAQSVEMEMDLRFEAAAAAELAENFADDPDFKVPKVDWVRTGRRVLTVERVSGIPIDERDAIVAAGHDPQQILTRAAESFFRQVFRDGFFHGDLHAGNLFVRDDGSIVAVDFGIMGRLDRKTRQHLGELLLAFLNRDYRRAAEVHFEAGWVPADRAVDTFTQACRSIGEPIMDKPQSEISIGRLLGQLFQVTETFAMETQPQLLLLQKTMLVAEGTGRRLCPDVNMWMLARPLIQSWMTENLGPEARLRETVGDVAASLARLPELLQLAERSAAAIADGRIRLHPETLRALRSGNDGRAAQVLAVVALAAAIIALVFQ
ncbi:MAG: 2-polyprenylphenol 6-hydroxylase [Rhodospirillales bacterium]